MIYSKQTKEPVTNSWLEKYKELCSFIRSYDVQCDLVEIIEIDDMRIDMEFIEGTCGDDLFKLCIEDEKVAGNLVKAINSFVSILIEFNKYSKPKCSYLDFNFDNIILKDDTFVIIDPDSLVISDNYHHFSAAFFNQRMAEVFSKIGERKKNIEFCEKIENSIRKEVIKKVLGAEEYLRKFPGA